MERVHYRIIYRGRVQGVGFRYTTASIARQYPVNGYVRNLSDGTVELRVEGPRGFVEPFLRDIATAFEGNISDSTVENATPDEPLQGFEIRP